MGISATEAFGLKVIGRAEAGGQRWIVYDDGRYRHVVEESHYRNTGHAAREADDERRADDYNAWCARGLWAKDDVAAEVAALCDLTHVHSAESGTCGRVDAAGREPATVAVNISICPTELPESNGRGDTPTPSEVLDALRSFVDRRHPGATIRCLQIGHRQGDGWAAIDGDDEAGARLMEDFWAEFN